MKKLMKKRIWACLMAVILCVSMLQSSMLYADTTAGGKNSGYVTVIFEDYGVRVPGDEGTEFPEPLGEILRVNVAIEEGDSIADITMKVLDTKGIECEYGGTVESGFYIDAIKNFQFNGKTYEKMGSLSAGSMSGWMVSINNWFAPTSASDTLVEDGDKVTWQYSCQWGADINYDYMMPSAEMTGLVFGDSDGVLSPEFATGEALYTYTVDSVVTQVALEVTQANYGAQVLYKAGDKTYKPMQNIPVVSGTVVEITSEYVMWDGSPNLTDAISIRILKEEPVIQETEEPVATETMTPVTEAPIATETAVPESEGPITTETAAPVTEEPVATETTAPIPTETIMPGQSVNKTAADSYKITQKWIVENITAPTYGTVAGDWAVLGLARSEAAVADSYYDVYYNEIVKALKATDGVLHNRKYTEYERVILSLTAAGYDATDVGGYNLMLPLSDYDKVIWQGVNSAAYALLALDCNTAYEVPIVEAGKTQTTKENLMAYLMEKRLADGGWALNGTTADVDMTALVIQALAPYAPENAEVKTAIENALALLSQKQKSDGTFGDNTGMPTAESTAQVILALTALGINPDTDAAFIKNGKSVIDGLCSFAVADGGFSHAAGGKRDGIATEQGFLALVSYMRQLEKKSYIYQMNDVTLKKGTEVVLPESTEAPDTPTSGADTEDNTFGDKTNQSGSAQNNGAPATGDTTNTLARITVMLMAVATILLTQKRRIPS